MSSNTADKANTAYTEPVATVEVDVDPALKTAILSVRIKKSLTWL